MEIRLKLKLTKAYIYELHFSLSFLSFFSILSLSAAVLNTIFPTI